MNLYKPENIQFLILHSFRLDYFPIDPYINFNKAILKNIRIGRIAENNVHKFRDDYSGYL